MGKFTIDDDCYAPRRTIFINYSGPDPLMWTNSATSILKSVWEVSTTGTGEPRWMWDWTGDPIQMYFHKMAYKKRGRHSKVWISIKMVGFKYKAKNEGTFKMEIEPTVRHKFEGNRFVLFLWWVYWHAFYGQVRQGLLQMCKQMTEKFIAVIKEMYKMGAIEME